MYFAHWFVIVILNYLQHCPIIVQLVKCVGLACLLILPSVDLELLWQWLSLSSGCNKSLSSELPFERVWLLSFYWAGIFLSFVCWMCLTLCYLLAIHLLFLQHRGGDRISTMMKMPLRVVRFHQRSTLLDAGTLYWRTCFSGKFVWNLLRLSYRVSVTTWTTKEFVNYSS